MGVYLSNMKMPKSCSRCFCMASCKLWKNIMSPEFNRHRNCPLVEIPPHGDLIDRSKLVWTPIDITDLPLSGECLPVYLKEDVDDAPTIIEAEEGEC